MQSGKSDRVSAERDRLARFADEVESGIALLASFRDPASVGAFHVGLRRKMRELRADLLTIDTR